MAAETIPFVPARSLFAPPYLPPGGIVMSVEKYLEWEREFGNPLRVCRFLRHPQRRRGDTRKRRNTRYVGRVSSS